MNAWTRIIGVVLALYAGYVLYTGRVASGDESSTTYRTRAEKPVQYWISVVFILALAVLMILNVFHF